MSIQHPVTSLARLMEQRDPSPQHLAIPTTIIWRRSTVTAPLSSPPLDKKGC